MNYWSRHLREERELQGMWNQWQRNFIVPGEILTNHEIRQEVLFGRKAQTGLTRKERTQYGNNAHYYAVEQCKHNLPSWKQKEAYASSLD